MTGDYVWLGVASARGFARVADTLADLVLSML